MFLFINPGISSSLIMTHSPWVSSNPALTSSVRPVRLPQRPRTGTCPSDTHVSCSWSSLLLLCFRLLMRFVFFCCIINPFVRPAHIYYCPIWLIKQDAVFGHQEIFVPCFTKWFLHFCDVFTVDYLLHCPTTAHLWSALPVVAVVIKQRSIPLMKMVACISHGEFPWRSMFPTVYTLIDPYPKTLTLLQPLVYYSVLCTCIINLL